MTLSDGEGNEEMVDVAPAPSAPRALREALAAAGGEVEPARMVIEPFELPRVTKVAARAAAPAAEADRLEKAGAGAAAGAGHAEG